MAKQPLYLFAGPSLTGTRFENSFEGSVQGNAIEGVHRRPPARRGDITALLQEVSTPGAIGLADGTFHAYPSVGHRELRDALDAGWQVFGLCSMGAIRVSELFHFGMVPWGKVARLYLHSPETGDDEVALLHSTEAPYVALSEPYVHIKAFVQHCLAAETLSPAEAQELLRSFKQRWYGHRTLSELKNAIRRLVATPRQEAALAAMTPFSPFRWKQQDLESFLLAKPWAYPVQADC